LCPQVGQADATSQECLLSFKNNKWTGVLCPILFYFPSARTISFPLCAFVPFPLCFGVECVLSDQLILGSGSDPSKDWFVLSLSDSFIHSHFSLFLSVCTSNTFWMCVCSLPLLFWCWVCWEIDCLILGWGIPHLMIKWSFSHFYSVGQAKLRVVIVSDQFPSHRPHCMGETYCERKKERWDGVSMQRGLCFGNVYVLN
jgi:hypothetical protein